MDIYDYDPTNLTIQNASIVVEKDIMSSCLAEGSNSPFNYYINSSLSTEQNKKIIIDNFNVASVLCQKVGFHIIMKISLTNDTHISNHPRKLSYFEKNKVNKTITEILESGVIRSSNSPYASPIVLVKKKSGS